VVVCPTGIDIRNGLQLECVNCTQCIDACNHVMDRVGRPRGLIRYSSQDALADKPPKLLRVRTIAYPLLLLAVAVGFLVVLSTKFAFDARVMRGRGNPFEQVAAGVITNNFTLRITNRTDDPRTYHIELLQPANAELADADAATVELLGGGTRLIPLMVRVPATQIGYTGRADGKIRITDDVGNERIVTMTMLGPKR
jgi:cytochrome c oxidase accessory protein FixG